MKALTPEESKQLQTELLLELASFCDRNGITYFLGYGTLLGAVRHKGYIPWDDDIDVWMPRPDYEKFCAFYKEQNQNPRFAIVCPEEKIARHTFLKMVDTRTLKIEDGVDYSNGTLGADIDIWKLDGAPSNEKEYVKWCKRLRFAYLCFFGAVSKRGFGGFWRRTKLFLLKLYAGKKEKWLKRSDKLHALYPYETCKYTSSAISLYNMKNERFLKEWFDETVSLPFEGYELKAPKHYHEILTQKYGDYMRLPPEAQRVSRHENNVFWKEDITK